MVDWISLSIAIVSLFVSLAISIISLIISWKGLQLGFGAFLSIEENDNYTVIKNLGEALAHNIGITLVDRNGNSFVKFKPLPFLNKNDEYMFILETELIPVDFLIDRENNVLTKIEDYPELTDIELVAISYNDIYGKRRRIYFSSFEIEEMIPRYYTIIKKKKYKKCIQNLKHQDRKKLLPY